MVERFILEVPEDEREVSTSSPSCLSPALSRHEAKANTPTPAVLHFPRAHGCLQHLYRL